jgi:hypothetical protein
MMEFDEGAGAVFVAIGGDDGVVVGGIFAGDNDGFSVHAVFQGIELNREAARPSTERGYSSESSPSWRLFGLGMPYSRRIIRSRGCSGWMAVSD